jgi:hypothetical protein
VANPFLAAGASLEKAPRYAPLHSNEFYSGYCSNRNPLRDPQTPYLYQKFYSATRYDAFIDGLNIEISPRLTPVRRSGNSVYNSQVFSNVQNFYDFRVINPYTTPPLQSIRVIVDTATAVYDGTGPGTKTLLFTKSAGAGQTSFQALGNTLYMGDGVDVLKWVWFPGWVANNSYNIGQVIIDSNNNLQEVTSFTPAIIMQGFIGPFILRISVGNSGQLSINQQGGWSPTQLSSLPGETATFSGFTVATFLNGQSITIGSVYNKTLFSIGNKFLTANTAFAPFSGSDGTGAVTSIPDSGMSGATAPMWATSPGATTPDSGITWTCKGPSVEQWGINPPAAAPLVGNQLAPIQGGWSASTYYWATDPLVIDSNTGTGPYIWLLTTAGETNSSLPSGFTTGSPAVGSTITDGSGGGAAIWTNQGLAARQTNTAYALGQYIAVNWQTVQYIQIPPQKHQLGEGGGPPYYTITYNNEGFFKCTQAGVSSTAATSIIPWTSGPGSQVVDNEVIWTCLGYQITRLASATTSPTVATTYSGFNDQNSTTTVTAGNVGDSLNVSTTNQIVDSSGNFELAQYPGESGSTHPTWQADIGGITQGDGSGGLIWLNTGPATAASTGAWIYSFAFKNSVTGHISSSSPASPPIVLAQNSYIAVSGNGDPNWQTDGVDTIEIYRSTQGATTLFFLQDIPAPLNGAPWSYNDFSPDPPSASSTLNEFIEADTTGNNAPPPTGLIALSYHLNRIWGAVTETSFYSAAPNAGIGVGAESFPGLNFFEMPTSVTVHWATSAGMFFYLVRGVYLSNGVDGNGNPLSPVSVPNDDVGILTPNCFTVFGSTPVYLTTDSQCVQDTPGVGTSRIAFFIEDKISQFNPANACLTWHTHGTDQALYVCDGSTGWYRGILTPAPESSGTTWAPFSAIVGGVQCIKSIETQPGLKYLLLGAGPSGGPILFRDVTTNSDNGSLYDAFGTIGSLVLAQSGQCAEIGHITSECLAIGSRPAISVLIDEIAGTFETIPKRIPDPPFLVDSQSIFSDRWYFSELDEPAWLHHMQMRFDWPAENKANEMLTYTIWGAVHQEAE